MDTRELLEESHDSSRASVEHEKRMLIISLEIGGAGLFLAGVGIIGIVGGAPAEGAIAVAAGSTLTYQSVKDAKDELRIMLEEQARTAQRELQLHELDTN